jgi:hypothetical protein
MQKITGILTLFVCWFLLDQTAFSQDSEETKAKSIQKEVKVTIDQDSSDTTYTIVTTTTEDGTKKVEKKTYNSLEEVQADSSLKVFNIADEDGNITMKLGQKGSGVMVFTSEEGDETIHEHKNVFVIKDEEGNISMSHGDDDVLVWVDEDGHKTIRKKYHVKEDKTAFRTARIKTIPSGDEEFSSFNLSGMPEFELKSLNYYPNPNEGEFTLTFTGSKKPVIVRILDTKGNLKMEENMEDFNGTFNQVLNVKHFDKGSYLLQIFQQEKVLNRKLVLE